MKNMVTILLIVFSLASNAYGKTIYTCKTSDGGKIFKDKPCEKSENIISDTAISSNKTKHLQNKMVLPKLTKEQESIYNKLGGKAKKIYKLQQSANKPIYFVGKIVDQDGNGVQGVEITYNVSHYPLVPQPDFGWVTQSKRTISDEAGIFVIDDELGVIISLRHFKKSGYEFSQYANVSLRSYKQIPNDKIWSDYTNVNPYLFKSWKKTKSTPLVHDTKLIGLRPDGRIYSLNFMSRRIKEEGVRSGDLVVSITMSNKVNNRFDWVVNIEALDGGIIESTDEIMNKAPISGYKSKWKLKMNKNNNNWNSRVRKRFYIFSRKNYGRIEMEFLPYYRSGQSAIDITYWINPTGSNNLQYSRNK